MQSAVGLLMDGSPSASLRSLKRWLTRTLHRSIAAVVVGGVEGMKVECRVEQSVDLANTGGWVADVFHRSDTNNNPRSNPKKNLPQQSLCPGLDKDVWK